MEGLKEASHFTQIPWVKRQCIEKLSIDPYPGTLNLKIIDPQSLKSFNNLKKQKGIEIIPDDPSFCKAQCYPVLINGQLRAAIVFPLVEGYPENKMELIASKKIKEALFIKEGEDLEVEIL